MRERIQLHNDEKHVQSFKHTYDRLFAGFQSRLMDEYKLTKEAYIEDYQRNYSMNLQEKSNNIDEFQNVTIANKKSQARNLENQNDQQLSCVERFYDISYKKHYYKIYYKEWKK